MPQYIVTCQAHPVLVKKGESNVRFWKLFKVYGRTDGRTDWRTKGNPISLFRNFVATGDKNIKLLRLMLCSMMAWSSFASSMRIGPVTFLKSKILSAILQPKVCSSWSRLLLQLNLLDGIGFSSTGCIRHHIMDVRFPSAGKSKRLNMTYGSPEEKFCCTIYPVRNEVLKRWCIDGLVPLDRCSRLQT